MQDDEIMLCNACTDLVSLRKTEAFPLHLLQSKRSGEWIGVRAFCVQLGVACGELGPEVFATWLPDPHGQAAYAVILFYDDESKWSMAAHYHRGRLVEEDASNQALQSAGAADSGSSATSSPQTAPALER